jgi:hypothetical protein
LFRLAAALAVASPVSAQWKPVADAGMVPTLELDLASGAPAVEAVPPAFVAPPLPGVQRTSRDAALMIVGGAAFLLGAVIGDDAGGVLMVGGAVVGLVGLYQYLR